jgi:hypothetical protein
MKRVARIAFGTVLAVAVALPVAASAQDKVYPPGTECANLGTIAERLLCGRQELRRGDSAVERNVSPPPYDGYIPGEDAAPTDGPAPSALPPPASPPRDDGGSPAVAPQ